MNIFLLITLSELIVYIVFILSVTIPACKKRFGHERRELWCSACVNRHACLNKKRELAELQRKALGQPLLAPSSSSLQSSSSSKASASTSSRFASSSAFSSSTTALAAISSSSAGCASSSASLSTPLAASASSSSSSPMLQISSQRRSTLASKRKATVSEATTVLDLSEEENFAPALARSQTVEQAPAASTAFDQNWFLTQPDYDSNDEEFLTKANMFKTSAKACILEDCPGQWSNGLSGKLDHYKNLHSHEANRLPHRFIIRWFSKELNKRDRANAKRRIRVEREKQEIERLRQQKETLKAQKLNELEKKLDAVAANSTKALQDSSSAVKTSKDALEAASKAQDQAALSNSNIGVLFQKYKKLEETLKRERLANARLAAQAGLSVIKQEASEIEEIQIIECHRCEDFFNSREDFQSHLGEVHHRCCLCISDTYFNSQNALGTHIAIEHNDIFRQNKL